MRDNLAARYTAFMTSNFFPLYASSNDAGAIGLVLFSDPVPGIEQDSKRRQNQQVLTLATTSQCSLQDIVDVVCKYYPIVCINGVAVHPSLSPCYSTKDTNHITRTNHDDDAGTMSDDYDTPESVVNPDKQGDRYINNPLRIVLSTEHDPPSELEKEHFCQLASSRVRSFVLSAEFFQSKKLCRELLGALANALIDQEPVRLYSLDPKLDQLPVYQEFLSRKPYTKEYLDNAQPVQSLQQMMQQLTFD